MPITAVYSVKGGQGVTTTAAALAILTARCGARTLLVDTAGDLSAVLNIDVGHRPGLSEYLEPSNRLSIEAVTTPVQANLDLIHRGTGQIEFDTYTYGLLTGGLGHYDHAIFDIHDTAHAWILHVDRRILITRPCSLAIRKATFTPKPDDVVLVQELERSLGPADIETVLGVPITATVPDLPAIARAVDAGTLTTRLPRELARALRPLILGLDHERGVPLTLD